MANGKTENGWHFERKITIGGAAAVLTIILGVFGWEYAQTAQITLNSKDIQIHDRKFEDLKSDIAEVKQSVKDVDKKVDEIKNFLIKQ